VKSGLEASMRGRTVAVILGALLLLVVLLVDSSFSTSGPVVGDWAEPVEGLQVAMGLTESFVGNGADAVLVVFFRNVSDLPRELPPSGEAMGTLSITHNRGRWNVATTLSPYIPEDEPPLRPGEERTFEVGPMIAGMGEGIFTLTGGLGWRSSEGRGVHADLGSVMAIVK